MAYTDMPQEVNFMAMFMSQEEQYTAPLPGGSQVTAQVPAPVPAPAFQPQPLAVNVNAPFMYAADQHYLATPSSTPISPIAQYKIEQPVLTIATPQSVVIGANPSPISPAVTSPSVVSPVTETSTEAATATDAPPAGKRKRKLTPEDKRRICQIYRNSQGKIRQEDIAREYSVDRSTISKILNQEERWLDPDAPGANQLPARRPGGRYPAIEEEMHRWLDDAVIRGREIRDSEAREEALRIGLRLGHPHFQASSKWWDGVKRRRVEEGRPMPTARRHGLTPSLGGLPGLVRSYSAMDPYPRDMFSVAGPSHYMIPPPHVQMAIRARSQSSPQVLPGYPGYASQPSSFGPAPRQRFSPPRHANAAALRQWTFPSNTSSPGRPMSRNEDLMVSGTSYPMMPPTPTSEVGQESASMHVPALSQSSGMSPLSVAVSDSDVNSALGAPLSPDSPRTPAHANFASVPMAMPPPGAECVDYAAYAQYRVYAAAPAAAGCAPEQSYVQPYYATPYEFVQPQW